VRDLESYYALDCGKDWLYFYRSIVSKWSVVLKENGMLMFECGPGQAGFVRNLMQLNRFGRLKTVRDTLEIERVVAGTLH
jgi:release factor glutamine methyltransferase